jgi:hypothetical protein
MLFYPNSIQHTHTQEGYTVLTPQEVQLQLSQPLGQEQALHWQGVILYRIRC